MRVLATLWIAMLFASILHAQTPDWPQWRGPHRDGLVAGAPWPGSLSDTHLSKSWRIELGPSYSGPIVGGDKVFTTETKDKSEEIVTAVNRATGATLWQTRWPGSMVVTFIAASNGSWIRATPAYDGECLYVAGMKDVLVCLDASTGAERWRVDFVEQYKSPLPAFGFVASPLVDGDFVYVQAGNSCFKLDKANGKERWRTLDEKGGGNNSPFASPLITEVAGRRQLLVQTRQRLAGVDLASGKVLWSQAITAFQNANILTPVAFGNSLFTSSYGGKSLRLDVASADGDFNVKTAWSNKTEGYMSTPVVINDHAYLHLRNQRFCCIDLKTGNVAWTSDKSFGKYWNLVANGDRILALDERGMLYLIKANPDKFELIDSRKISDQECWAHLAVVGDEIFVRELKALTAYRWK